MAVDGQLFRTAADPSGGRVRTGQVVRLSVDSLRV